MRSSWKLSALVVVLCLGVLMSGCYGPFNLTKRVHAWNGDFDGDWAQEGMFLVCSILPIYGFAMLGDALIFNSIEFWGGDNPIDPPMAMHAAGQELDKVAAVYGLPPEMVISALPEAVVR
ncbi:MAG: DUF3332 family protein [Planctomycetota bacterium]|jgi:hypothetical protein